MRVLSGQVVALAFAVVLVVIGRLNRYAGRRPSQSAIGL